MSEAQGDSGSRTCHGKLGYETQFLTGFMWWYYTCCVVPEIIQSDIFCTFSRGRSVGLYTNTHIRRIRYFKGGSNLPESFTPSSLLLFLKGKIERRTQTKPMPYMWSSAVCSLQIEIFNKPIRSCFELLLREQSKFTSCV